MATKYIPIPNKEFPGWYEIPGFSGYCANTRGHILNKKTKNFSVGGRAGRYLKVSAYKDGSDRPGLYYVHIMVCTAFHGPGEMGAVVLHKDNNRNNNTPNNLKWGTQSENILQVYKDGLKFSKKFSISKEGYRGWMDWGNDEGVVSIEDYEYVSVNSSNIDNVGFDPDLNLLSVEFKNGSIYQYQYVDDDTFYELVHAPSVGRYFAQNIKNKYIFNKVN